MARATASKGPRTLEEFRSSLLSDPIWLCTSDLMPGIRTWTGMRLIYRSVFNNQRTSVRAAHGLTKTYTAATIAITFLNRFKNSIVVTTAPTHRQVEKLLWKEIRGLYKQYGARAGGNLIGAPLQLAVNYQPEWYMFGFSTDYAVNLEGLHASRLLWILDEAKGLPQWLYDSMEGSMTGGLSRVLEISTTDGADQQCPLRHHHERQRGGWNCIKLSAFDSPFVDASTYPQYRQHMNEELFALGRPENGTEWPIELTEKIQVASPAWIEDKRIGGETSWEGDRPELWETKVLAEFAATSEHNVIPSKWVLSAINAPIVGGDGDREWGFDIARYGDDSCVLTRRKGGLVEGQDVWGKTGLMETAGRAVREWRERGCDLIKVDADGIGAGVFDRLVELEVPCVGIQSGSGAYNEKLYANYRAEMWFHLAGLFEEQYKNGNVISIPDDEDLIAELTGMRYKVRSDGRYLVEDKEGFKKRVGRSPDKADSLVYSFAPVYLDE
jgi:hypothetical protein